MEIALEGRAPGGWTHRLQGFILTALLSFGIQASDAQVIIITPEPKSPVVGGVVNLTIPSYGVIRSVHWYRSKGEVPLETSDSSLIVAYIPGGTPPQRLGPNSTHRETVFTDGSLQIKDLMASDVGPYTVQMQVLAGPRTGSVDLKVSGSSSMKDTLPTGIISGAAVAVVLGAALITIAAVLLYKRLHRGTKTPTILPPRRDVHHLNRSNSVNSDGYIDPKDMELPLPTYLTVLPPLPNDQTSTSSDTGHVYEELQYADKNLYNHLQR